MKKYEGHSLVLPWFMALLLSGLLAACGGGGKDPILGVDGVAARAPTVTAVAPLPNALAVSVNTKIITAAFSKAMDPATLSAASFSLACPAGTPIVGVVSFLAASNLASLTLPASSSLAPNTLCTATVTTAVKDSTGIALESNFVWTFTTGAIPDTTAPTVTATINANGATGVAINTKVGATFSEAMDPATITATTFTFKQGTTPVAGAISYSGVNAVFTPTSALANNTNYTATMTTGAKDIAGNALASNYTWSWTTGAAADTTAPTVTATINANGATGVAINTKVGATFSEAMDPLTITTATFLFKQGTTPVIGTISYSGVNAVFTPTSPLASNTNYTATMTTGAKDLAGNALASNYVWSWTTGAAPDTTAPTVTGTINANGATGVAINTKEGATFSEAMDPLTITTATFLFKQGTTPVAGTTSYSGVNAVFTPTSPLANNTNYTATLTTGAKDIAGNALASNYVWSWTTGAAADTTAPTVVLVNPADQAINVAVGSAVNATFSKAMDPLTINTASFTVAGVTGTVAFNATSKIATFTPSAPLAVDTSYTATVSTASKDLAGNALAVNKVWSFRTAAVVVVPPTFVLGSAAPFGTFGGSAGMTNQGLNTVINGDIGSTAVSTAITGFHDATPGCTYTETGSNVGTVNGGIYTAPPPPTVGCPTEGTGTAAPPTGTFGIATVALADALKTYNALVAAPVAGTPIGANLSGLTVPPGVYVAPGGSFLLQNGTIDSAGDLTLDGLGDANAVWVFKTAQTLTVGGPGAAFPRSVNLINGAQAKNVFWQVGSFATINAAGGGTMVGTIITQAGASFSTAGRVAIVTLNGRALSLGASVTLVNTVINVPAP